VTARLYVGDDVRALPEGASYVLPAGAARHVAQALRMRSGEPLVLFTGEGGEYHATIEAIDRREVAVRVQRHVAIERETARAVTLVQAVIAADMMDLVVRKAVELGAAAIVPVLAARSQGVPGERIARRVAHWRQIAIAACEQCGRNRIPEVADVVTLAQWLASPSARRAVILDASAPQPFASQITRAAPDAIVSGPEGGFTRDELASAQARGVAAAHLGPRVLRAETAPIAALAALGALSEK
jgi:16S rRNA (uracil1498-N3)-methyltransferase